MTDDVIMTAASSESPHEPETARRAKSQAASAEATVKVRVCDRWRVVHDGKPHHKGDTLTVPEHAAQEWERAGWVQRMPTK